MNHHLITKLIQIDGQWTLKLIGDVNIDQNDFWVEDISNLLQQNLVKSLAIDLSRSDQPDSRGLRFLLDIQEACSGYGITVVLRHPSDHLRRLLRIMQFDRIFIVEPD